MLSPAVTHFGIVIQRYETVGFLKWTQTMAEIRKGMSLYFPKRTLQNLWMNEAHNQSLRRQGLVENLVPLPHTEFRKSDNRKNVHCLYWI